MASKAELLKSLRSYLTIIVLFVFILILGLILTELAENSAAISTNLQLSPQTPWGMVTSLFMNYKMINLTSNLEGLAFYFLFFCFANAFLDIKERNKRFSFFAVMIFAAGILANLFFLVTAHFIPHLQVFSSGTSAIVYGVEGSAFLFAILNLLSIKTLFKSRIVFGLAFVFFNAVLLITPIYELYSQLANPAQVFFVDGVNIIVHYYAFAIGLFGTLVMFRNRLSVLLTGVTRRI